MHSIIRQKGGRKCKGWVRSAYLLPSMEIFEPTLSQRVPCELHASQVRTQTTIVVCEDVWCEGCRRRQIGKKKKGQEMVDGLQAICRKPEASQHAFPTPSTAAAFASSRLPPLSIGTATLTDHTDCKPGAGIARLPLCRSAHRLQPGTPFLPLAQDGYRCHQETESRF